MSVNYSEIILYSRSSHRGVMAVYSLILYKRFISTGERS